MGKSYMKALMSFAATAILTAGAGIADAQTAATATGSTVTPNQEEVVITGTRRVDRTVADSASPIDVISNADLNNQPASNMMDQVKYLVPSFFVGQNTISDASTIIRAPSLRGLGSDQVLVMLNGKRFNRSALVQVYQGGDTVLSFGSQGSDISSIPSIGIKHLEVLRDGATAQYGSDAIAGVLNYGLRDNDGLEVQALYGQYKDQTDGQSHQYAASWGTHWDRFFVNISGEYDSDGQTSRGVTRPTAVSFATETSTANLANTLPNYPLPAQIWGQSPTHGYKFLLNSAFDVTDNSKIYLFGNYANSHTDASFNFRSSLLGARTYQLQGGGTTQNGGREWFQTPYYQTQCPANNTTCPAVGLVKDTNVFNLSSLYPGGFTPRFTGDTTEMFGVLGYKGTSGAFGYDASVTSSSNKVDLGMHDSISGSFGADTQTAFKFGDLTQKEFDANLDLTYQIEAGLASPLTLSGGGEYRKEQYTADAGDFQSYGAGFYAVKHPLYQETSPGSGVFTPTGEDMPAYDPAASGFGGTSPTYAGTFSQNSHAFYLGLEGDVVKNLSMGAMARYENYESFGSKTVWKFNTIWHVNDALALRGTLGTGFHAPSPGQDNVQNLTTTFAGGVSLQQGTFPVNSAVAKHYYAVPLKPETSKNYGVGIVLTPMPNFTVTVDAYKIDVTDRISISQSYTVKQTDIDALPELASVGLGGSVQYFTNGFDTTTKGVDVVGTYHMVLDDGSKLGLSLAYNYNKSEVTSYDPLVIANKFIIDVEHLAPQNRATLALDWGRGPWSATLRENYFGSWGASSDYPTACVVPDPTTGRPTGQSAPCKSSAVASNAVAVTAGQSFGAKFTTDANVSYGFLDHYVLTVGGRNLFNTYPDKIMATTANPIYTLTGGLLDGQVLPRNGGPFGINGAFYYGRIAMRF
jgi:iron complex outermembrane receptor protein